MEKKNNKQITSRRNGGKKNPRSILRRYVQRVCNLIIQQKLTSRNILYVYRSAEHTISRYYYIIRGRGIERVTL